VLTGIAGWLLLRLPRSDQRRAAGAGRGRGGISPGTIVAVLRTPRLGVFFIASVVVWTSHAALQGFITLRVQQLGGDGLMIAATWSLGALIEVPLMTLFPRLARRFGAEAVGVDPGRVTVPVSATMVREAPADHLDRLAPPVRAWVEANWLAGT